MRFSLLVIAVVIASVSASRLFNLELDGQWESFKSQHGKNYEAEEEVGRRLRWERNLKFIEKHNAEAENGVHTFRVAMNQFGDMTNEEFRRQMNGYRMSDKSTVEDRDYFVPENVEIPDSVDWRTQGYVTPVKDQGQCGSCWAFSSTGSLEGQHFKATGKLVSLSEQNLVDCSGNQGNQGCDGGLMDQAFTYIKVNKGIDTEKSYPYEAVDGSCRFKKANVGATDKGFKDVQSGDESDLTNAIATVGPISVAIDASQDSFQFYSSGVYYEPDCSSTELDHGVLAVGYGKDSEGKEFYIVKNSWAATWGDKGFIMMSRNKDNNCGIATAASYPLV